MLVLVRHGERSFSLQINITKDVTSIVQQVKYFSMISFPCILLLYDILIAFSILVLTVNTQPAIACSELAMEALQQYVGCVQGQCLFICMCIYVCVCTYVYIIICMCLCMCLYMYICMCVYVCMCIYIYIYVEIVVICLYCRVWTWLAPCSGIPVTDFGQVNACWVLVISMTRFLLTNDIFDCFIYFVVIFCSIRLFIIFHCKYY